MAKEARIDPAIAGEEALARSEWSRARELFEEALAARPGDPRALDGLGYALFWVGEERAARDARERAYVAYRRSGDARRAAGAAVFVSSDYRMAGDNAAAAAGWLARAERCLDGEGDCAERGWIEIERAKSAADPETAAKHARRAAELARVLRDADLEVSALAHVGNALVRAGRWEEGMALLDEAMAEAMGGGASDAWAIGDACCQTLVACDQIADLRRAAEWCRVVVEFTERRNYTPLYAWCRAIYAGVLVLTGAWERAESVLLDSLRTFDSVGGIGSRVHALARLAELRLRQGRLEEAERLLEGCDDHPLAVAQVIRCRLLRNEVGAALALAERRLSLTPEGSPALAELLPVVVDVRLAQGDLDGAAAAVNRLDALAGRLRRDNVRALAELARAELALARGRPDAGPLLDGAVDLFARQGMPYEEGVARLRLAELFAAESPELAGEEARRGLAIFERLGAFRKADEASALLRSLGLAGTRASLPRAEELTGREQEVLALLAEGLSNAEIAARLVISRKTAGHHVGRIFRKLGLRNRAEAAAYAVRAGARTGDPG